MCLVGGAAVGWMAAMFDAFANDGSYRMIAAIAILASIALGGSRGTRRVATLLSLRYREISARYGGLFPYPQIVREIWEYAIPSYHIYARGSDRRAAAFAQSAAALAPLRMLLDPKL